MNSVEGVAAEVGTNSVLQVLEEAEVRTARTGSEEVEAEHCCIDAEAHIVKSTATVLGEEEAVVPVSAQDIPVVDLGFATAEEAECFAQV